VLRNEGITDFSPYGYNKGDFFLIDPLHRDLPLIFIGSGAFVVDNLIGFPFLLTISDVEPMVDFFLDENQKSVHSSQYAILSSSGGAPVASSSPPPASSETPSGGGTGEVTKIVEKLKAIVNEDIVKATNAIFQFEVKGEEHRSKS